MTVRLLRLHVEGFGPIRKACVELGAGLNVLYGENDLGKSYLAHAVRAALLLPHTSTAHQEFVAWGTDETPRVALVFQAGDGTCWRVKKAFGKTAGAAATLERSPDGEQWSTEAKGRDVDGRLRKLLEWGIPEPGGKGKKLPRGLPRSFLTHVLLAEQHGVEDVFDRSLVEDPDESGKKLLGQALQALAQDPLFKEVLERSRHKVDEAFLPSGKKRRGRHDPFQKASQAVRDAYDKHEQWKRQLEETRRVREQLQVLSQERLEAQAATEEATTDLEAIEEAWRGQQERRVAEARLADAEARLADAEARLARLAGARTEASSLAETLARHEQELDRATQELRRAELELEQARERRREAESDQGVRQRELEKQRLDKRRLELQAAERDARERFDAAEKAGASLEAVGDLEARIEQCREVLEDARAELDELVVEEDSARQDRELLRGVGALLRRRRAAADLGEAVEARARAADLRGQAEEKRAEGEALRGKLAGRKLPGLDEVRALRELTQELEVARARLDVGLSVRLRLARAVDVEVSRDGAEPDKVGGAPGVYLFEAKRTVALELDDLAGLEITAGAPEARRRAEELARRWREQAVPVLEDAGVPVPEDAGAAGVEALARACHAAEAEGRSADERIAEARRLEAKAAELDEPASRVELCRERLQEREAALEGHDRSALEAAAPLGGDAETELETRQRRSEEALRAIHAKREEKKEERDRADHDLVHLREKLEAEQRRRDELTAALDRPWEDVLAASEAESERLGAELDEVAAKRRSIDEAHGQELAEVQAAVEAAARRLESARAAVASRTRQQDETKGALESLRGQLEVLRENAETIDPEALKTAVEQARVLPPEPPGAGEPVTEERIARAREALGHAERTLADKSREVDKLRGALEQVGGDVAAEREKMALEALLLAKDRERELELDYGAWQLLVETLRQAEDEESMHLGRALVDPVSEKFSELTDGRYGKIGLDPDLGTTGIRAVGGQREVASLSQGLKEQLATIFRISVAQHLESMIVLDDQLTHTDPRRLSWFRDVLRKCGETIQVVVLTCRPLDYLFEGELVDEGQVARDGASGRLRGVDLERVVDRAA